ncbi:MAG TPA: DUF885 domain-containing protein, partial [Thermoanaerobaculia bacterium]
MKRFLVFALLVFAGCATSRRESLKDVADAYWQHQLQENVALQIKFGLPTPHLSDVSYAHAKSEAEFASSILKRLDGIDAAPLNEDDRLTLEILRSENRLTVDGLPYFWYRFQVSPYALRNLEIAQVFTMQRLTDSERSRLLAELPRVVDAMIEVLQQQRERGIVLPKAEVPLAKQAIEGVSRSVGGSDAFQRLWSSISETNAPDAIGLHQYPGGDAAYRYFVRARTTVDLTPDAIHQLGLREVERINGEMQKVRDSLGFKGTQAEFNQFLKTDPRFFAKTPEEAGARLTAYLHKIEPHVQQFFSVVPKARYDVQRLNPSMEGGITFGYYQQPTATDPVGHYYYNGSRLNERNQLFAPALIAHELIPGHHFQIARQEENESLPPFRRENFDTAYIEGWGEYAAALGNEMGIYDDPYDRYGRLMMDMMLSVRLVVDTGMNALGWSRERAAAFMRENTLLSETEISTETLRYAVDMPAQALAYKIGSLKMMELRRNAQQQLGPRFDIRQFHEWIIGSGSMPLPILEQHV